MHENSTSNPSLTICFKGDANNANTIRNYLVAALDIGECGKSRRVPVGGAARNGADTWQIQCSGFAGNQEEQLMDAYKAWNLKPENHGNQLSLY